MEGVDLIALIRKEPGQGQGEGVGGVNAAGRPVRRGNQPALADDFRVEGGSGDKQRGVEVLEADPLLLQAVQIGGGVLRDHPGVYGFHHNHNQVFALQQASHLIVPADFLLPGGVELVQFPDAFGVPVPAQGGNQVPEGVLVQAGELHAPVRVCEEPVELPVVRWVIGALGGEQHNPLFWGENLLTGIDGQQGEHCQAYRERWANPGLFQGPGPLAQADGQGDQAKEYPDAEQVFLGQLEIGPAEGLQPVPGKVHVMKAEKVAEDVEHHRVEKGEKTHQAPHSAHGNPPAQLGQQGDEGGNQQGPAPGEEKGEFCQQPHAASERVDKPQGIVHKDKGRKKQRQAEKAQLLSPAPNSAEKVQHVDNRSLTVFQSLYPQGSNTLWAGFSRHECLLCYEDFRWGKWPPLMSALRSRAKRRRFHFFKQALSAFTIERPKYYYTALPGIVK